MVSTIAKWREIDFVPSCAVHMTTGPSHQHQAEKPSGAAAAGGGSGGALRHTAAGGAGEVR